MVFNINTTRFPSKISFRSNGINYFWYFRLQVDDGIQSCCSFWSSLVYSMYRCVRYRLYSMYRTDCTHLVHTVQSVPYRLYTPRYILYTPRYILYSVYRTDCTVCTVQTVHTCTYCTVQTVQYVQSSEKNEKIMELWISENYRSLQMQLETYSNKMNPIQSL